VSEKHDQIARIRKAARLMRQRAEAAKRIAPQSWRQILTDSESLDGIGICKAHTGEQFAACDNCWTIETYSELLAEHAVSWHPGVALAVAALLNSLADLYAAGIAEPQPLPLAIVRAYLGEVDHG
jgi:hypothetical protein